MPLGKPGAGADSPKTKMDKIPILHHRKLSPWIFFGENYWWWLYMGFVACQLADSGEAGAGHRAKVHGLCGVRPADKV